MMNDYEKMKTDPPWMPQAQHPFCSERARSLAFDARIPSCARRPGPLSPSPFRSHDAALWMARSMTSVTWPSATSPRRRAVRTAGQRCLGLIPKSTITREGPLSPIRDAEGYSKVVVVKFFAPWCTSCKVRQLLA